MLQIVLYLVYCNQQDKVAHTASDECVSEADSLDSGYDTERSKVSMVSFQRHCCSFCALLLFWKLTSSRGVLSNDLIRKTVCTEHEQHNTEIRGLPVTCMGLRVTFIGYLTPNLSHYMYIYVHLSGTWLQFSVSCTETCSMPGNLSLGACLVSMEYGFWMEFNGYSACSNTV